MTFRQITTRASGEAGFALVEALVAATILIGVALATLSAVEGAQTTSRLTKDRSTAAALAEQAQERMRALPATALANFTPVTDTVPVGAIQYSVTSRAEWVRDATGGTQSCTSDTTQADYLKVSSTVTSSTVGTTIRPVTLTSLVAPPLANRGSLAVHVTNSRGQDVAGLTVNIAGPTSATDTTNSAGCAIFAYIPSGNYHVLLNTPGWVDPSGTTALDQTKQVTTGNLSVKSFEYDRAGAVTAKFETLVGGNASPSRGWSATGANNGVPGGVRPYFATNPPQPSVVVQNLYPFTTNYEMFSGECAGANPRTATPDPNWYTSGAGAGDAVTVAPGDTSPVVTVRQPPLNLVVQSNASNPLNGARVVLTPSTVTSPGCTVKPELTTNSAGRATKPSYNFGGTAGTVAFDPGVPFGVYDICADATVSGLRRQATISAVAVTPPGGNVARTITIDSSSPASPSGCP
jgi:Tfp pilus assembly protein PilV